MHNAMTCKLTARFPYLFSCRLSDQFIVNYLFLLCRDPLCLLQRCLCLHLQGRGGGGGGGEEEEERVTYLRSPQPSPGNGKGTGSE